MGLKHARLTRAENLPESIRSQIGAQHGLVIIETRNEDLRDEFKPIRTGGMREYLLSLGDFIDVNITD